MPAGFFPSSDCLQRFARSLASENEPGFAVGVYAGGDVVSRGAAGCAVPEHGVPVTEHTVFDIASVSKHMTAACLLLLARDGLIDLDADIRPALPELALGVPVTLRQCLSHTSGLRDYFALCEIAGIGVPGMTEDRFTDLITGQRDLDFPPGSAFSYSNTGYALASLLVRRATGSGLAQVAADRVFSPLGMTATHFRADVSRLVPRLAAGYVAASGGGFRRYDTTEEVVGDGAVVTSLADLAAWHGFLADGAVLGRDIRDGLTDARPLTGGSATGYGLGLQAIAIDQQPAWWHSGSWAGYRAALISLPQHHAGVTVLANRNDRYASLVALAVAGAMLTGDDPADRYRALPGLAAGDTSAASAEAAALAGTWHEPDLDIFIDVAADGGQLVVGAGGEASAKERFFLAADGRWRGLGAAAAGCYAVDGGDLVALSTLSGRTEGRYRRGEPDPGGARQDLPAGLYWNGELRAAARLEAANPGARIAIGLAPARRLVPAGDGVWRCQGGDHPGATPLTVRVTGGGSELLVSAVGARRVRFGKVTDSGREPELPRGLRDWAR